MRERVHSWVGVGRRERENPQAGSPVSAKTDVGLELIVGLDPMPLSSPPELEPRISGLTD